VELGPGAVEEVVVNQDFWKGKRVLVTGHTGFKGSWLCLWLTGMGAEVAGYSISVPTTPALFELARIDQQMRSIAGDVRDRERLYGAFAEHRPEIVFHMAAQSLVRRSYRDPVETYETNVIGTVNLLEAVRHSEGVRVVVNVTTDKVYENHEWEWGYRENEPKGGHDPYSNSKACSELVTAAYRDSFFGPGERPAAAVATARAGNVIGGGDWGEDRLIPDLMRGALEGETVMIRHPGAVRPWQHVLNPLSGYLRLAERLWGSQEYADAWNFGPDDRDARSVRAVIQRLSELWGEEIPWREDPAAHPHEAHSLRLDSSKARLRLGWVPRWDLERALLSIAEWYRGFRDGEDPRELVTRQIEAFERGSQAVPAGV
jgi:CDP-glucose 4,6-dehydratase